MKGESVYVCGEDATGASAACDMGGRVSDAYTPAATVGDVMLSFVV